MILKNMTPHVVKILKDDGIILEIQPESVPIRIDASSEQVSKEDGIIMVKTIYHKANFLPEYVPGTCFIVSSVVKQAHPERFDFVTPSNLVRGMDGNVICCKCLSI